MPAARQVHQMTHSHTATGRQHARVHYPAAGIGDNAQYSLTHSFHLDQYGNAPARVALSL